MVSLSRPALAAVPSVRPNSTAGFWSGSSLADAVALAASASNFSVFKPASVAATTPKFDSAEKRPPMVGSP